MGISSSHGPPSGRTDAATVGSQLQLKQWKVRRGDGYTNMQSGIISIVKYLPGEADCNWH